MKHSYLNYLEIIFLASIILLCGLLLFKQYSEGVWQHFSIQADSFMLGRLDIVTYDTRDLVLYQGKYYWPQGPFPSLFLIPFKLITFGNFDQIQGQIILLVLLGTGLFKLATIFSYSIYDRIWLVVAFLCGSVALPLVMFPATWFYAQLVTMTLMVYLLLEWIGKKRYLIIGLLFGAIFATRPTAGLLFIPIFLKCLYEIYQVRFNNFKKIFNAFVIFIPVAITFILLLWFNFARFENAFDNGYSNNEIEPVSEPLRDIGVFSVQHIPMNLYWYFLASFIPVTGASSNLVFPFISFDPWGLSFFIVSPIFIYALVLFGHLFQNLKKQNNHYLDSIMPLSHNKLIILWGTIVVTLLILLMYFNTGWATYGPRYTADFLPLLFVILMAAFPGRKLSFRHKLIITFSCLLNMYMLNYLPLH